MSKCGWKPNDYVDTIEKLHLRPQNPYSSHLRFCVGEMDLLRSFGSAPVLQSRLSQGFVRPRFLGVIDLLFLPQQKCKAGAFGDDLPSPSAISLLPPSSARLRCADHLL